MAAAYAVADGGPVTLSPELELLAEIKKYGVQAVMGRPLYHHEVIRLRAAERVINAYSAKFSQKDWAKWAKEHKSEDAFLNMAMRLAGEYGWS